MKRDAKEATFPLPAFPNGLGVSAVVAKMTLAAWLMLATWLFPKKRLPPSKVRSHPE